MAAIQDLIIKVLTNRRVAEGRNGKTLILIDDQIKFDLAKCFPIVTGRPIFWRGVVEELLWILRGQTNSKILEAKNINIWKGNSSAEFLAARGLEYEPGDIGPGYGFQLRHFGKPYGENEIQGIDQLATLIWGIKHDPGSRRHFISLWNPTQLHEMALPPCHVSYQFNVVEDRLYCHLYQRSWDVTTGWNSTTAGLLTHIVAHICGLGVAVLTHSASNIHIYDINVRAATELVQREWPGEPMIKIEMPPVPEGFFAAESEMREKLDAYLDLLTFDMFKLVGYAPLPAIKFEMVE